LWRLKHVLGLAKQYRQPCIVAEKDGDIYIMANIERDRIKGATRWIMKKIEPQRVWIFFKVAGGASVVVALKINKKKIREQVAYFVDKSGKITKLGDVLDGKLRF